MKKLFTLTCLSALLIVPSAFAADTYVFDTAHSSIGFQIRHLFSNVPGKFDDFSGTIQFDEANPDQSSVEVNIKTASIDTGVKMRDDDLRSPNFFDATKFPETTFKSKSVKKTGDNTFDVTGDLTMHGVTKEVVLDVDGPSAPIKDPWGNQRAAASATTKINRQDFGVKWNKTIDNGGVMLGDEVSITIDVEMFQPAAKSGN